MTDPDQVIKDYVSFRGGKRVIRKILIANNGLAAVRFIRRLREWSFTYLGNERALHFIAMPTPEDIQANAEYFRIADEFKVVPGGSNKNNFAKVDLIVETAKQVGADAVWPGWGHASENPALPNSLEAAGIVFMGPSGRSMDAVGDKICANLLAQSVGVNVIPWSGTGLKSETVELSPELIKNATLANVEECVKSAERVGFPLMIKASEGGGGKGIRMVKNMEELRVGFDQVQKEVVGSPIFIQKLGVNARHLEVQLVADEYGTAISLYGRDCSVQRRHQKVIEEGPVRVCSQELCRELEAGAVRLAQFVGYRSAGTVEYLYSADTKEYSFLEVNPRLQVEHPVTEGITGCCVPAIQLNVAMGVPLHAIPDIRQFYGEDPAAVTPLNFPELTPRPPLCHTVAARITAENPEDGFKPTSGQIHNFFYRPVQGVSASFSVSTSGAVHQFADSQFGHLFSHAATRELAVKNLLVALKEINIRGEISNNTPGLQYILQSPAFASDTHSTGWLDVLIANNETFVPKLPEMEVVVCGATVLARNMFLEQKKEVLDCLERGVVPDESVRGYARQAFDLIYGDFKYPVTTSVCQDFSGMQSSVDMSINGGRLQCDVVTMFDGGLKVLFNGESHVVYSERTATGLKVVVDGKVYFFPDDADPTALQTASAGKLVSYLVADGDTVQPGQPYAEIEVMKTIMPLLALNGPGKVTTLLQPGMPLQAGDVLARLELAAGASVKMATKFTGQFPEILLPRKPSSVVARAAQACEAAKGVCDGYGALFDAAEELVAALADPSLPASEAAELLTGLPPAAEEAMKRIASSGSTSTEAQLIQDAAAGLAALVGTPEEAGPVHAFLTKYSRGRAGALASAVTSILQSYLAVENYFDVASTYQDAILELRDSHKEELGKVAGYALSHTQLKQKNAMVVKLLNHIKTSNTITDYIDILSQMTDLEGAEYAEVGQACKEMLFSVDQAQRAADHNRRRLGRGVGVAGANVTISGMGKLGRSSSLDSMQSMEEELGELSLGEPVPDVEIPDISVASMFDYTNRAEQAKAVKEYFETVGVHNAIQASGANLVKMQYGNGASAFVAADVQSVPQILQKVASEGVLTRVNILLPHDVASEEQVAELMQEQKPEMEASEMQKVSFTLLAEGKVPVYLTYSRSVEFEEDKGWHGTEPALCLQLELERMCNFEMQTVSRAPANAFQSGTPDYRLQVLYAKELGDQAAARGAVDVRLFVRAAVYNSSFFLAHNVEPVAACPGSPRLKRSSSFSAFEGEQRPSGISESNVLVDMMRNLELAIGKHAATSNSFFVNLVSASPADMEAAEATVAYFVRHFMPDLARMKVSTIEVKVAGGRILAYNPAGSRFKVERHTDDEISGESEHPYPVLNRMQRKKMAAQRANSTYVYDFLEIFEDLVTRNDPTHYGGMSGAGKDEPAFRATELVVNAEGALEEARRPAGNNDCGMVVFRCWMRTPECRSGREFVIIASDLSFQSGSFSPREDVVYFKALELCMAEGIPSVYIAANSGARIGLNEEVKKKLQVAWVDASNPHRGYEYLYLSDSDYQALSAQVHAVKMDVAGETRHRIVDVFGGCGVECLQGSGMIATATSKAYEDTVTMSYVTGRSVGIGAYISRLSQRIIQHSEAPLLLTGAAALNKVLGRQVYSSNAQIGGPKVMHHNGVSHEVVTNDVEGCTAILRWLSYVPAKKGMSLPIYPSSDSVERRVEWIPPAGPYNPREMLAGGMVDGEMRRGFFDDGSFTESLSNWGKTVVTGRARLGGLPVGVVAVETRTQERVVPADPGFVGSTVQVMQQAGQVWFPDSAYKTANAINDFNREGIPLFVFANWRGFAGGQRDMFDEVLKYGSYIVDALRTYKQPVFVYLPCGGELRGGAWVVIDSTINPDMMRMYTSENAKGNVLEPEGIVEIKFRKPDMIKMMKRNDAKYAAMEEGSAEAKSREKELLPIYTQLAVNFAALHDTPGVMKQKGVVTDIVPWATSRTYFYKAMRERLAEVALSKGMSTNNPNLTKAQKDAFLVGELKEVVADLSSGICGMSDVRIDSFMKSLSAQYIAESVTAMPLEAVIAGLLKDHTPEQLVAILQSGKSSE
eukprot:CAMPEP_0114243832 /NCGR_PEP_ID=MMETSP0058-20121206/11005_1 /TAXON_ID=36894 /ORGANISM="Pyramimonas parkeae, CCMP726" /LENGTH=2093 /DNA_ID=CAMNT_0001356709 /DNA_START=141 /DNA_END=6422 /DNA_ORIENTATION=+